MAKRLPQYNMSVHDAGRRMALLLQATKKAENATCFFPGCTYKAIGSHVLQERGILNQIAEEGHIIEFAPLGLFEPSRFERAGIGSTNRLKFYGFCKNGADHDRRIFEDIENNQCDFSTYREHLLLSYRALCNGFYNAKMYDEFNKLVVNDKQVSLLDKYNATSAMAKNAYASKELERFKYKMEKELFFNSTKQSFIFYRYEIPRIDIVACHMFAQAFRPLLTCEQALALNPNNDNYRIVAPIFFINLVPRNNKLIVIIGHIKGIYGVIEGLRIDNLGQLTEKIVIKLISDILVRRIDTWAMSIELYDRLSFQNKINQYLKFNSDYYPKPRQRSFFRPYNKFGPIEMPYELAQILRRANRWEIWKFQVPFNLFDGII